MRTNGDEIDTIIQAIQDRLNAKKMNQADLAEATGIPLSTLNRRLRGIGKTFEMAELITIANALDTSLPDLVTQQPHATEKKAA